MQSNTPKSIEDVFAEGTIEELRALAAELAHENRRLRRILDASARAGLGVGAAVEIYQGPGFVGFAVCRADSDEAALLADLRGGIERLSAAMGGAVGGVMRTGVTRDDGPAEPAG